MSKLKTDLIEPRVGGSVELGGIDPPTHNGIPLADVGSPTFVGNPTFIGNPLFSGAPSFTGDATAVTRSTSDSSGKLATTQFVGDKTAAEFLAKTSSAPPTMNGVAASGVATTLSRSDHVHPSDTTKANVSNQPATFLFTTPGTYTNIFVAPVDGWIKVLLVGGGGGGGAGGADLYGTSGTAGGVFEYTQSCPVGSAISLTVGAGGLGGTGTPTSPGNGAAGGSSSLTRGASTQTVIGGTGGSNVSRFIPLETFPGPYRTVVYGAGTAHSLAITVAIDPAAANTPMSVGGISSMDELFVPTGNITDAMFASDPLATVPIPGQYGGAGCGAPACRMSNDGGWIDPILGFGTSTTVGQFVIPGGMGGAGVVYFEFHAGTTTTGLRGSNELGALDLLRLELKAQGINVTVPAITGTFPVV
jgi:hypothetical protein